MYNGKTVLCEVGVGPLSASFGALHWGKPDMHVILIEPHPLYGKELLAAATGRSNVEVHNVAIGDEDGITTFYDEGTSSALDGILSPFRQIRGPRALAPTFTVDVRKITHYDHGQIDYLRVDTEGAEYYCLKHLVSRPRQIVVEMYDDMASYVNPFLYEIEEWAKTCGYKRVAVQDSDFIYQL